MCDMRDARAMAATDTEDTGGIVVIKDKDPRTVSDRGHPGTIRNRAGPSEHRRAAPECRRADARKTAPRSSLMKLFKLTSQG